MLKYSPSRSPLPCRQQSAVFPPLWFYLPRLALFWPAPAPSPAPSWDSSHRQPLIRVRRYHS